MGGFCLRWARFDCSDVLAVYCGHIFNESSPQKVRTLVFGAANYSSLLRLWFLCFPAVRSRSAPSPQTWSVVLLVGSHFWNGGFRRPAPSYTGGLTPVMGYKISLWVASQLLHLWVNLSLYWTSRPGQFNQPRWCKRHRRQPHLGIIFRKQHFQNAVKLQPIKVHFQNAVHFTM